MNGFKITTLILLFATQFCVKAQKSKVQAAWRSLTEYEESLKEGRPDPSFLEKASQAIDQALANEETSKMTKAQAYKLRISYAKFQLALSDEMKKLETTVQDKNERAMLAYGNVGLQDMEAAIVALNAIKDNDPK